VWRGACAVGGARQLCWDWAQSSNVTLGALDAATTLTERASSGEIAEATSMESLVGLFDGFDY